MGKNAPTPPAAPDPTAVSNAQTQSNEQTAAFNAELNRYNTSGPNGSTTWSQGPNNSWTQTTALSPEQQQLYDQTTSAQSGALGIANTQLGRISGALGAGDPYSGLPSLQYGVPQGTLATSFNPGQAVQGQVGPQNFGSAVQDASNAAYSQATSRLDPQWNLAQEQEETKLAQQGLNPNDEAYKNAMQQFGNAKTDAYNQANYSAVQAGNDEQARLYGELLSQGQFANQAAAQQYGQNEGLAQFGNQAEGQQFAQGQENASLNNETQGQAGQEHAYSQNLPINEFTALMGNGQVSMPTAGAFTPSNAEGANVLGAYQLQQQGAWNNYNANMKNYQANMAGLENLGGQVMSLFG